MQIVSPGLLISFSLMLMVIYINRGDMTGFVALLNKYIAGEIHIAHEKIPASIDKFYQPKYYDRLQKIIISVISRRK